MHKHPDHSQNLVRLRRIEGQIRGIQKMIEEGKYCVDILTQIHAAIGSLSAVEDQILEKHLSNCVSKSLTSKSVRERQDKLNEIVKLISQFRKIYR